MADRIRILLIDDQPHFADLARAFLEREDDRFDIDTAIGPAEGLERLHDGDYDCIVSDYEMPEMTGLDLFNEIDDRGIDLPFILFTGIEEDKIEGDNRLDGLTAYLQKGGTNALKDLASRIRLSVAEHRAGRELLDVQHRYHALFEQTSLAMAWITVSGGGPVVVDHNDRFRDEFIHEGMDIDGQHLESALKDVSIDTAAVDHAIAAGDPISIDGEVIDDDAVTHYRWRIVPLSDEANPDTSHALIAAHDISDRATNEQELDMYRTIVEASGDPMYVLDMTGRFTYVNDALLEMTGLDRGDLIGESGRIVMSDDDYDRGTDLIKELLRSDRDSGTFEMDLHTAFGETIPSENHVTLIYDVESGNGDEVKGTAGVIRDISARKQRIAELRRYNERLEELAAFISHDLRNPINIATGHLKLVEAETDSKHYQAVWRALHRMEELVDDLLLMAESGQSIRDPAPVPLNDAALLSWSQVSTPVGASINVDTDRVVVGDGSRIRQLFENLFTNAVVHGDDAVSITVGAMDGGFYVEDDGPGIPDDIRDDVFDFGYTTGNGGSGFGLSIVKAVADAHEWTVTITESSTGGARFEFTDVTLPGQHGSRSVPDY